MHKLVFVRQPRLQHLMFYLLEEGRERAELLKPDAENVEGFVVETLAPDVESLFVKARPSYSPPWVRYVQQAVEGDLDFLQTSTASGLLILAVRGRFVGVTFGHGRHLINPEVVVHDFGLKVVLNSVPREQLKSVDAKTVDELTIHTRRDASREAAFSAFGLDVSHDLLRAVTGTPRDPEEFGARLAGSDGLKLSTRRAVSELPELAEALVSRYLEDTYRTDYAFIDYLRHEKSPQRIRELETKLLEDLNAQEWDAIHLAAPEVIDWQFIDGVRFTNGQTGQELAPDPRISKYMGQIEGEISVDVMKHDKVEAVSDDVVRHRWSVYECLVYETDFAEEKYVLSGRQWYRIDADFRTRIEHEVRAIPLPDYTFPAPVPGMDEEAYNKYVAEDSRIVLLDRRLVRDPQSPDKMEISDLLDRSGRLIHVKQRGRSSTLSHLFAQGVASAEQLSQDLEFLARARTVVEEVDPSFVDVLSAERLDPRDHEICFLIMTRSQRNTPLTLPFFAVLSLHAAKQRLEGLGFQVTAVAVVEPMQETA